MSQSVVCSGCGARLEVSEDYARKKMRCDQCGVIFDLPEPANRSSIPAKPASRSAPPATPVRRTPNQETNAVPAVAPSETPSASTTPATPASRPDEPSLDDSGDDFAFAWNDKTVGDFFDRIRRLMPPDNPGSLPPDRYRDIIAFVLQENKYPEGDHELSAESAALHQIKITAPPAK